MEQLRGLESLSCLSLANVRILYSNFQNSKRPLMSKKLSAITNFFMCQLLIFELLQTRSAPSLPRSPFAAVSSSAKSVSGSRTAFEKLKGYTDKFCPVSTKMHRTLVIRREYLHFVPKYNRYEKRHKNLSAHVSPAFRVEEGDLVTVGQCRPLSKTVRSFVILVNFRYFWKSGSLQNHPLLHNYSISNSAVDVVFLGTW